MIIVNKYKALFVVMVYFKVLNDQKLWDIYVIYPLNIDIFGHEFSLLWRTVQEMNTVMARAKSNEINVLRMLPLWSSDRCVTRHSYFVQY